MIKKSRCTWTIVGRRSEAESCLWCTTLNDVCGREPRSRGLHESRTTSADNHPRARGIALVVRCKPHFDISHYNSTSVRPSVRVRLSVVVVVCTCFACTVWCWCHHLQQNSFFIILSPSCIYIYIYISIPSPRKIRTHFSPNYFFLCLKFYEWKKKIKHFPRK